MTAKVLTDETSPFGQPLIPARMLNEYAYCPRLAYLEWVQGEFRHNADTLEGRYSHRRVDQAAGEIDVPQPDQPGAEAADRDAIHARSVLVASERLHAIARVDLIEGEGRSVIPVDYKRGSVPDIPERAWEPERVQVCLQGLILRDNGFACDHGLIYFVESKSRVPVFFDDALVTRTLTLLAELQDMARAERMPPPLTDSKKCPRCSLVGICLPDEVNYLAAGGFAHDVPPTDGVRRLFPARDDALPVYVQAQGTTVSKTGDLLKIRARDGAEEEVRLLDVSQLCLFGNVQVTAQALRELCEREIPICHFSYGGRFFGITQGMPHKNVELRRAQFRAAEDEKRSLALAAAFVQAKILNCRTLLRRNYRQVPVRVLRELSAVARKVEQAPSVDTLLGFEGIAARIYFAHFAGMLKPRGAGSWTFDFDGRNRRPPRDPVNALLSFAYAMLTKDAMLAVLAVGFDPYLGFYHAPRYGRPSLALDLMEEFRPLIADSVVLGVINNGEIDERDFIRRAGAVALTDSGRRKFLEAYERRMDTLVTHPVFGYRISYRRVLEVQARLLARHVLGEIERYPAFRTR